MNSPTTAVPGYVAWAWNISPANIVSARIMLRRSEFAFGAAVPALVGEEITVQRDVHAIGGL